MANLRLLEIKAIDSTSILAKFTENLSLDLNTSNVEITSNSPGVPDPEVLFVDINDRIMRITTRPMSPYANYFVRFKSSTVIFRSRGGSVLLNDNVTNVPLILGPEDPENPIRDYLLGYLEDQTIYDLSSNSLNRDLINSQAEVLSKAYYAIKQSKNDNYLDVLIEDEQKIRGKGPFDRLNEEGAYKIIKVSKNLNNTFYSGFKLVTEFPASPISLQAVSYTETLTIGTGPGTFDKLILNLTKFPVIKINSIIINYQNGNSLQYSLETLGYQLQNSRYDDEFASTLLTLEDNQVKLSDILLESLQVPAAGDEIEVNYDYKSLGKIISEESVIVTKLLDAIREVAPPIITKFTLENSPIVNSSDVIMSTSGVQFLDPEANPPFSGTHPAFTKEVPFKLEGLPHAPGEFSVDYTTGDVYVYGAELNDGTGDFPPACSYKYRKYFTSRLDYTYDPSSYEIISMPNRDLRNENVKISFDYEQTLIPGIDFISEIHEEFLDERINNNLTSLGSLKVNNTPITNVFRILNETSGELYKVRRWSDSTVYFNYNIPPKIVNILQERASFTDVTNETLIVNEELTNLSGIKIYKILLNNDKIMSSSEDVLGASFNTSVTFSNLDIFNFNLYFDNQELDLETNLNRLQIGSYQIDHLNGIIYVAVNSSQNLDLGTINYKKSSIKTSNSHILSVSELYNSINPNLGVSQRISYTSFSDTEVIPNSFELADERFLNGDNLLPYYVSSGTITVSDNIKNVRGIYDAYDLNNNEQIINFSEGCTFSSNVITLEPVTLQNNYFVETGNLITLNFISPGAEIFEISSVIRISDNVELYDSFSSFSGYVITLSGSGSPTIGDEVIVSYKLQLNGAATPLVDYNRGDFYIDYSYLADEILVSYESGDNRIDYRQSGALDEGETYYCTYRVGALRDALLKNFGTLVNIPILNNFDTSLNRETYREALYAALQSFTKGPTLESMRLLVSTITHIDPEIIEGIFEIWSLGLSYLYPNTAVVTGTTELKTGKFDQGLYLSENGSSVSFPASSNFKLEEGTFESWIIPDWNGLDNDATLTINITKNNETVDYSKIYIGSSSYHPTYDDNSFFKLNKNDELDPSGLPGEIFSQTGVFIYYDTDNTNWKFLVRENISDGYVYSGTIETTGEFYNVKFIPGLNEINDYLRTTKNKITFQLNIDPYDLNSPDGYSDGYNIIDGYFPGDGYSPGYSFDGFNFMSDEEHYILDVGENIGKNRISLFKDGKGYISFRIFDKGNRFGVSQKREISYDISNWAAGENHHVAISWKINNTDHRDEMHLFIDGLEVPNIVKYGGRPISSTTDRFRTIVPELLFEVITDNAVVGNDLQTTIDSTIVSSSSLNFSSLGILPGGIIQIKEPLFTSYNIISVTNNVLVLDSPMPTTLDNARFTINPYSTVVSSEIDLYNNIAVSVIRDGIETELAGLRADLPAYEISKNSFNENVLTILGGVEVGDTIAIRTLGLNHYRIRERQYLWGDNNYVLKTQLPPPINLDEVKITSILLPLTSIGPSNSVYGLGLFTASGITCSQPSSSTEGRTLSIRVTGSNVDFSTPVSVNILGTTAGGPTNEILTFNQAGVKYSVEKFKTISSVTVVTKPLNSSKNSIALEIKEKYSITYSDGNNIYPVIRFSYQTQTGTNLTGSSGLTTINDDDGFFPNSSVGQILVISSPLSVAGNYTVTAVNSDTSIEVSPALPNSFTAGSYSLYNTSIARSGFQNGFFTLEQAGTTNTPFILPQGYYEFDYSVYLELPFDPISNSNIYLGSSLEKQNQIKGVIDEVRVLSTALTDVRIGETLAENHDSITTDYTRLKPFVADYKTLLLLHFDDSSLISDTDFWVSRTREFLQTNNSLNENFEQALQITTKPLVVDNAGLLSTNSEGTIEFWVSPIFDTYNDPNLRYYFDATSAVVEEVVSITNNTVKTSGRINQVLSVKLSVNDDVNYFINGSILDDYQTIKLGKALPSQQTLVKVSYIPSGVSGDRISIYKDSQGYIVFYVKANNIEYEVRRPIFWEQDSWHRIMATFKFNNANNRDEIRLLVDGEERGTVLFGSGLLFGQGAIFGQGFAGLDNSILIGDIDFTDTINQFFIGSDYLQVKTAQARFDNLKLSNIARRPLIVAGQAKDVNYSSNIENVLPAIEDLYTTYLLNFNTLINKNTDFSILRDEKFGIFNFTLNVIDSFKIVSESAKIKQILEILIKTLKPSHTKTTINYLT